MNTIVNTSRNTLRVVVAAAAVCAALAGGVRADEAPQVHVSYADLNLNTSQGATALYQRIHGAAVQVCALPLAQDLGQATKIKVCMARAIAESVAAVNNPNLTRVYEQKAGTTPAIQLAGR